jgi:hypothetical protein
LFFNAHQFSTTGTSEARSKIAIAMLNTLKEPFERSTCRADAPINAQLAPQGMLTDANKSANATLIARALHPSDTTP